MTVESVVLSVHTDCPTTAAEGEWGKGPGPHSHRIDFFEQPEKRAKTHTHTHVHLTTHANMRTHTYPHTDASASMYAKIIMARGRGGWQTGRTAHKDAHTYTYTHKRAHTQTHTQIQTHTPIPGDRIPAGSHPRRLWVNYPRRILRSFGVLHTKQNKRRRNSIYRN